MERYIRWEPDELEALVRKLVADRIEGFKVDYKLEIDTNPPEGRAELVKDLSAVVKKQAHGHSYGKEAVFALVDWATENLDLKGFIYPVDRRNSASRRIPEALVSLETQVASERPSKGEEIGCKLTLLPYQHPSGVY